MATQTYFMQNTPNGNGFATVSGFPQPGSTVISQPYNGGPAQQWIPAQYPGTDLNNQGGVVCVLYSGDEPNLVLTAGGCQSPNTLQPFQLGSLFQLWSYPGAAGGPGRWINLATGCSIDLSNGNINGGIIQTWPTQAGNNNQSWGLLADHDARAVAESAAAPELEAVG